MHKNYTQALSRFKEVLGHWPDKAETYYNIACMYSRLEREEESIEWLQKAIDKGYSNWESIKSDSDLENIRDADAYKELVKGH
jgi:tetratricopeptide (TPR) repeat protein